MEYYKIILMPEEQWLDLKRVWQIVKLSDEDGLTDDNWKPIPGDEHLTYEEAQKRVEAYEQAQLDK